MIYNQTAEAIELYIFSVNEEPIYRQLQDIKNNLIKKYKKGIYDHERAIDAFYHVTTAASNLYKRFFGYSFTVQDRFTTACDLAINFEYNEEMEA